MERRFDPELLKRLAEERHRLVANGSFGQSYNAAVDAYRLAQENTKGMPQVPSRDEDSGFDPKRDYKELE